jgi:phosphatidylserine/phosphatidylglycerophosphate/cardiolipin synthase-like enzyme
MEGAMRVKVAGPGLTVQAIAGTHVVMLGFDLNEADCTGLRGFAIHRTDHQEEEATWLQGMKTFEETDPGLLSTARYSTRQHPVQSFSWADFSAKPGYRYTYRVLALKGPPTDLQPFAEVKVELKTESPADGLHDVYFNRGAAASQEYARRFGPRAPNIVGPPAFNWLSRGLFEAIRDFIGRAQDSTFELRVSAYEFHYPPVLEALKQASQRGATVRVIYDSRQQPPRDSNAAAVLTAGLDTLCIRRSASPSALSHNKFIILLQNGQPEAVLTGGTNFSEGGIFGHSNSAHIVEEPEVARAFATYWELLATDPKNATLRPLANKLYTLPTAIPAVGPGEVARVGRPPAGTGVVFSPRSKIDALEWYAGLAGEANDALFATFAFGMHPLFQKAYRTNRAGLRFALMESATRPMQAGPDRDAAEQAIVALRRQPENRFAIGAHFTMNRFDRWVSERLSGLNSHVRYVHTKYMLIDPLGSDPLILSGSANFSAASSSDNDENMLVIRGDKRVADIYLGEFMRLYNHFAFREWAHRHPGAQDLAHLRTDDWWREYFGNTPRSRQRAYFVS